MGSMKRTGLFREEALVRLGSHNEGVPVDTGQRTLRRLGALMVATLFVAALVVSQLRYARKLDVSGVVTQASIHVVAPKSGVIAKMAVTDGARVNTGDALYEISADHQLTSGSNAADVAAESLRRREALAHQQTASRQASFANSSAALSKQKADVERERAALEDELRLQESRLQIAQAQQAKDEELIAQGFMSRAALYSRHDAVLDLQQKRAELIRSIAASEKESQSLEQSLAELAANHSQAGLAASDSIELIRAEAVANEERQHALVRSPALGTLDGVGLVPGDYVVEGQTLAHVFPAETKAPRMQFFVPASASAAPLIGMPIVVEVRAFPYQKYGLLHGRIISLGAAGVSGRELTHVPIKLDADEIYFRVVAELDENSLDGLAAGMAVDGVIKLEERSILGWLASSVSHQWNR